MLLSTLFAKPSAFLPMTMSVVALAVVLIAVLVLGDTHQTDEDAAAHLWQLLVFGQLPIIAFFAIRWLPRGPRAALQVLGFQAIAVLLAAAPVYLLHL